MKCKPYSEITVEIGTQLKTVKITFNIFAVYRRTSKIVSTCWILRIAFSLGTKMQIYPPVPPGFAYPAVEKHGATTNFRCLKHISQIKSPFVK